MIEPDDREVNKWNWRKAIGIFLNVVIVILTAVGLYIMFKGKEPGAGLSSSGFENFKYFTVLSNVFSGIVAALWLILFMLNRKLHVLPKLISASAVGLTFLMVAAFLAPAYPNLNLYTGGNLYFHLIVPLFAMVEFILYEVDGKIPFKYTLYAMIPSFVYGIGYLINILINGVGEWPNSNDWYGFLNWGYPVGFCIFAAALLMIWGMACILRILNYLFNKLIK